MTYILPWAAPRQTAAARLRGTPARRPAPPTSRNGGETPPQLGAQPWAGAAAPGVEAAPPGPRPIPSRRHPFMAPAPRGAGPYLARAVAEFPQWRGEAGPADPLLSAEATGSEREGGEGGGRPGKSPSATGQPRPVLILQKGGIPLKPALTERPGGSIPLGRASSPSPLFSLPHGGRPQLATGR